MKTKYFNNAGAGIMSQSTLDTVVEHMQLEMKVGAYKAAAMRTDEIAAFYSRSAKLINAKEKNEIAFIDSASRGWNLVIYGLHIRKQDKIVTLETEYGTNLLTIYDIAKKSGCLVDVVKCNKDGSVDIDAVNKAMAMGGTVLAVSHIAAQGSIINPVVELGKIAARYNAIYIVDGCQAVGQVAIDVQEMRCHAYMTAGRKWLCGPRGTGILYVSSGAPIRTPQIDLASADLVFDVQGNVRDVKIRTDAKQFELWEKNTASLLGLSNAIKEYTDYGIDNVSDRIKVKANRIRKAIFNNPKLVLVGSKIAPIGTAGFYLRNPMDEERVRDIFADNGFIISCMCDWDCPISFPKNGVKFIFRITPHYYTDDSEVNELCEIIERL